MGTDEPTGAAEDDDQQGAGEQQRHQPCEEHEIHNKDCDYCHLGASYICEECQGNTIATLKRELEEARERLETARDAAEGLHAAGDALQQENDLLEKDVGYRVAERDKLEQETEHLAGLLIRQHEKRTRGEKKLWEALGLFMECRYLSQCDGCMKGAVRLAEMRKEALAAAKQVTRHGDCPLDMIEEALAADRDPEDKLVTCGWCKGSWDKSKAALYSHVDTDKVFCSLLCRSCWYTKKALAADRQDGKQLPVHGGNPDHAYREDEYMCGGGGIHRNRAASTACLLNPCLITQYRGLAADPEKPCTDECDDHNQSDPHD